MQWYWGHAVTPQIRRLQTAVQLIARHTDAPHVINTYVCIHLRVALFATCAIAPGEEEITFDYGYGTAVDWQSDFHLSGRAKQTADTVKVNKKILATLL